MRNFSHIPYFFIAIDAPFNTHIYHWDGQRCFSLFVREKKNRRVCYCEHCGISYENLIYSPVQKTSRKYLLSCPSHRYIYNQHNLQCVCCCFKWIVDKFEVHTNRCFSHAYTDRVDTLTLFNLNSSRLMVTWWTLKRKYFYKKSH